MSEITSIYAPDTSIEEAWKNGRSALLLNKLQERYEDVYDTFKNWCSIKHCISIYLI